MAARFWVSGGNGNINSTTNWSATSGGASGASVPGSADDVNFDANGNSNATINVSATWLSLTITSGYTATITHNAVLTIASGGSLTLGANYTIAGSSSMTISGNNTLTSNGKTWPNSMTFVNSGTRTLIGNFVIGGTLTISTSTTTINSTTSETISVNGIAVNGITVGTAKVILSGGTWSASNVTGIANNVELNGNVTISGTVYYRTGTLSYVSGSITISGSTLRITGSCSFDTNGMDWNGVTIGNTSTITLVSNFSMSGLLEVLVATTINSTTSETFTTTGGVQLTNILSGNAQLYLSGGTWSAVSSNGPLRMNTIINGNITVSGTVYFNSNTLSYNSGTVTVTGSTLDLGQTAGSTLDTNGMTWNTVSFGTFTYNINSLFSAVTILTAVSPTFAGTHGWTCGTFSHTGVSAFTITLKEFITYTITNLFSCFSSRVGSIVLFTSSHGTNRANLILNNPSTCNVLANFTRIDASGGRTINTFNGTVTGCVNIRAFNDLATVGTPI
jgi:hypothetical protein